MIVQLLDSTIVSVYVGFVPVVVLGVDFCGAVVTDAIDLIA